MIPLITPVDEERVKQIAAHMKTGLSYSEIGAILKISRSAVAGIVHRHLRDDAAACRLRDKIKRREREAARREAGLINKQSPRPRLMMASITDRDMERRDAEQKKRAARWRSAPVDDNFVPLGIDIMDIRADQCRFIEGDPKGDWSFCGHKVAVGPYCVHHARRTYVEKG